MPGPEVLIHEEAFLRNFRALQKAAPGLALMPVIKADAYGHGAEIIAQICEKNFGTDEVPYLIVARVSEARALRASGVRRRLLVLSEFSSGDLKAHWPSDTDLAVQSEGDLRLIEGTPNAGLRGVHFNVNTGMNRLGFKGDAGLGAALLRAAERMKQLNIEVRGLMTHLACGESDPAVFSLQQEKQFLSLVGELKRAWSDKCGKFPHWIHAANSPGLVRGVGVEPRVFNAARPGIHLWGASATSAYATEINFEPVAEVTARMRQMFWVEAGEGVGYGRRFVPKRRSLIGTVALGYADGVNRGLSRGADEPFRVGFIVDNERVPIAGTVSMDLTMIDLTDHPRCREWGLAVERGESPEIELKWICRGQRAEEIAETLGTISYEVLCALSHRLPRRWVTAKS